MLEKLNIPKRIKVGYQKRNDTYTGMLAYIVYFDSKGVLRKENSWQGWRDKKIEPQEFDNEPTSGFVLNKGVGGVRHSWGWNARNEYVRVYDPRNFEFEISVSNLLFILQECSAIKGKGLEGEFVYAWEGTTLVLLPVGCPEYKQSVEHCELQLKKLSAKDIEVGCTYINKDKEEVMYMGRLDWYDKKYTYGYAQTEDTMVQKTHVFVHLDVNKKGKDKYWIQSGFTKLATRTSDKPISQYAEEYEALMKTPYVSKPVSLEVKPAKINMDRYWYHDSVCVAADGKYYLGSLSETNGCNWNAIPENKKYDIVCQKEGIIDQSGYKETVKSITRPDRYGYGRSYVDHAILFEKRGMTLDEVKMLSKDLYIVCENGTKYKRGE